MALLFVSAEDPAEVWRQELLRRLPELDFRIWPEAGEIDEIDAALVWRPPAGELRRLPKLQAILSLGAGVEALLEDPTLPDVPLVRMVDPSLTDGMCAYVLAAVLRHHRELDRYERAQRAQDWAYAFPPQARDRRIGVMGLGELGSAVARTLLAQGFPVAGWSRSAKAVEGVASFAGHGELHAFLHRADVLICLLPLTDATRGTLDAATFAALPKGAFVINVGRGEHLVDADLLAALDSGHLAGATLDVFRHEPLPPKSPLWDHPRVLITPHVASYCDPRTAADGVADNLRRLARGEPLLHVVDRARGY